MARRDSAGQLEQVELRADVDGRGGHAEAGRHPGAVAVELGAQQPAQPAAGEVVVDLEGEGALARAHRPVGEAQHGHAGHKLHLCHYRKPKVPLSTIALLSGRTRLRSSSQPSSPSAAHGARASASVLVLDVLAQRGARLGEGARAVDEPAPGQPRRRRRPTRRRPNGARSAAPRAAPHRRRRGATRASIPSSPASTRQAMCPSPRNSRSSVMACHSARCGASGHGRLACAA